MNLMTTPKDKIIEKIMDRVDAHNIGGMNLDATEIKQRLEEDCFTYNDFLEVIQDRYLGTKLENYIIQKALNRNVE